MGNNKNIKHASVLIETLDGKLLFHHRDNRPDIIHPDLIGTFGGGVEAEEGYPHAAIRELKEELNLAVQEKDLMHFADYKKVLKDGNELQVKVFLVRGINAKELVLNPNEGQNIVSISRHDDWRGYKFTPLAKAMLGKYSSSFWHD